MIDGTSQGTLKTPSKRPLLLYPVFFFSLIITAFLFTYFIISTSNNVIASREKTLLNKYNVYFISACLIFYIFPKKKTQQKRSDSIGFIKEFRADETPKAIFIVNETSNRHILSGKRYCLLMQIRHQRIKGVEDPPDKRILERENTCLIFRMHQHGGVRLKNKHTAVR